jgi:hypothetical protein
MLFVANGLFSQGEYEDSSNPEDYDEYHNHWYNFYNDDYIDFFIYGNVVLKQFYGPPNYGETPEEDRIEYHYVLELYDPITFTKGWKREVKVRVEKIQLIFNSDEMINRIDLNWGGHVVEGKLYFPETGHHHTPLIMIVDRINLNG